MTDSAKTAAMQGAGFYNRHSTLQAANITSALPLLEQAAGTIPTTGDAPLCIADYGASQGRNSMLPMGRAIGILRGRAGPRRPIGVVHIDLPANDFQSLFTLLADDPQSYLAGQQNIFPAAIGRSYFAPVLPPASVDLGWSSNALHWMSRNPADVPDHGWAIFSAVPHVRDAVETLLEEDWLAFLTARGTELRPGAKLVCQFMGRGEQQHGFEWMAGCFWQALLQMQAQGLVSAAELLRMNCPSASRSVAQIQAPFAGGEFAGLSITHVSVVENPDPFWAAYQENQNLAQFARSWAGIMRAANGPNFVTGLNPGRDPNIFLDELTNRLVDIIAASPQRSVSYMVLVALEKTGETTTGRRHSSAKNKI